MNMSGERLIAATREKVWAALHDATILKDCIPGCESVQALSGSETQAIASFPLGPIAARFTGMFQVSETDPLNGYRISGQAHGGIAGSVGGNAALALTEAAGGTRLAYHLNAVPEGKMAELNTNIFEASMRELVESFFTKFSTFVAPASPVHHEFNPESPYHDLAEDHDHDPSNPHYFGLPVGVLIAATVATISVALTILKFVHIG